MKNPAIIWTFAGVFAVPCFAWGLKMNGDSVTFYGLLWYTLGALIILGSSVLWLSLEETAVFQHKIIVGFCGLVFGGLAIATSVKWFYPTTASAQSQSQPAQQAPTGPCSVGRDNSGTISCFNGEVIRPITAETIASLVAHIPAGSKVSVAKTLQDWATAKTSVDIAQGLIGAGYQVTAINTALGLPYFTGITVEAPHTGYNSGDDYVVVVGDPRAN